MAPTPPLNIIITGAGIGGLAAALTLRRAGHSVHLYERSSLNNELGAAIHVAPNASRGLQALGLDPVAARFVDCKSSWRADSASLKIFHEADDSYIAAKFGAPWWLCHRVDLHEALKTLALGEEGEGVPAVVHLKAEATDYNPAEGTVTLADGSVVSGDLVLAADGVHSKAVEAVTGHANPAMPTERYNFCYRFLIPTAEIAADPETVQFTENDDGRMKFVVSEGRRLVWYPCRNNEQHNFVAIFSSDEEVKSLEDYRTPLEQSALLETYKDFHPSVLAVLRKAKDIKQWPLLFRAPLTTWYNGKLALLGDAAHPMLPHQGQGGAQAIEDGLALGLILEGATPATLPARLALYQSLRLNRASAIQHFSNAGQDEPEKIQAAAARYMDAEKVPKSPEEFFAFNFGYDIIRDVTLARQKEEPGWEVPKGFFEKAPGRGTYP